MSGKPDFASTAAHAAPDKGQGEGFAEAKIAYGIERVPVDYFHWNGYRYTTLRDAIAAARRARAGDAGG